MAALRHMLHAVFAADVLESEGIAQSMTGAWLFWQALTTSKAHGKMLVDTRLTPLAYSTNTGEQTLFEVRTALLPGRRHIRSDPIPHCLLL